MLYCLPGKNGNRLCGNTSLVNIVKQSAWRVKTKTKTYYRKVVDISTCAYSTQCL